MTKNERFLLRLSDDLRIFADEFIPSDADTCTLINAVLEKIALVFTSGYKEIDYEEE